jgi:hypothetical protein
MKTRLAPAVVVALAIATLSSTSRAQSPVAPAPSADRMQDAEAHFRRGVELYKDGDSGGALVEFKRAYDLSPNYRVLYNLGQTYFQLQRYADALKTLQAFLSEAGAQIPPDRRASVENDVRQLQNRVGQVDVKVNVDGAQILVDDEPVGTSPLAQPAVVSVGHRKITATKAGMAAQDRFVDVAAGDRASVAFDFPGASAAGYVSPVAPLSAYAPAPGSASASGAALAPAPAPAPTHAPTSVPAAALAPTPPPSNTGPWLAWGVTGAFAAGTVVTGLLNLSAKSELSTQLGTFPGNPAAIEHARTRMQTFGLASDVLLGATAVAGGVALYLTLKGHSSGTSTQVGVGLSGVQLKGRF